MGKTDSGTVIKNEVAVSFSNDEMSAFVTLPVPFPGTSYTVEEVTAELEKNKVIVGVMQDEIQRIIKEKRYGFEIPIANGQPPVHGKDGYFEFLFPMNTETRPKILEDGSVDYSSLGEVSVVEEGTELVRYIPPVRGKNGITVRGKILVGRNGRELQPLKGKGFLLSEDKRSYTAAITGKAEYDENSRRLTVSSLFVVKGDVSHVTGNVQFAGDIHIRGNVITGMFVKAYGSIIVDGCVEAAHLIAGRDVTLKNGMQGGGKGIIEAGGNVSGKFFEQTSIRAKGSVNANAIMNCNIISDDRVQVSGKLGIIVGGSVSAIRSVEATLIGNMNEVKTRITVGTDGDLFTELSHLLEDIQKSTGEAGKLAAGLLKLEEIIKKTGRKDLAEKKMQLLRLKIEKESALSKMEARKAELLEKMEKSANSRVVVQKTIYPGVMLSINGVNSLLTTQNYNVTYTRKGAELAFVPNF